MLFLGFLTVSALAAPLDEALEDLGALEARRAALMAEADSVGRAIGALPEEAEGQVADLLRSVERLAERSRALDLEILLTRQRCRSLALRELDLLQQASDPATLERERAILDLLERRLADHWGADPVFVEPDSLDGYETLLDKQAYLADLRDRLARLSRGLARRIETVRREESLRRASERFAEEARFLDEGGRLGADEQVPLRGLPGDGGAGDGAARSVPSGSGGRDPEAAPTDGFASARLGENRLDDLEAARSKLEQDLNRVARALRATEDLLERYESAGS